MVAPTCWNYHRREPVDGAAASEPQELVADVTKCPTLGAKAKQPQTNPLMDNYEGMTTTQLIGPVYAVSLMSDDNFGATQITRFLTLAAILP